MTTDTQTDLIAHPATGEAFTKQEAADEVIRLREAADLAAKEAKRLTADANAIAMVLLAAMGENEHVPRPDGRPGLAKVKVQNGRRAVNPQAVLAHAEELVDAGVAEWERKLKAPTVAVLDSPKVAAQLAARGVNVADLILAPSPTWGLEAL